MDPFKKRLYISVSVAWIGGWCMGYYMNRRKLGREFDERLEREMRLMKAFYAKKAKREARKAQAATEVAEEVIEDAIVVDEDPRPVQRDIPNEEVAEIVEEIVSEKIDEAAEEAVGEAFDEGIEALVNYGTRIPHKLTDEEKGELVMRTKSKLFLDAEVDDTGIDRDLENIRRAEGKPYVISHDEYISNAPNHEQEIVFYYAGDDTLCDDADEMIDDVDGTVGTENLGKFGQGTPDKTMVYVRNERIGVDFEVVRHQAKYSVVILGFDDEPKKPVERYRFKNVQD